MKPAGLGAGKLWLGLLGSALLAAFAAIAWVQHRQVQLLETTVRWEGDSLVWGYFRLESEFLKLHRQLEQAARDPGAADAEALRLQFEIMASRLPLLDPQRSQTVLPLGPEGEAVLPALHAFVAEADPWLAELSDRPLAEAPLVAFATHLAGLAPAVHAMILQANQANADQIAARNAASGALVRQGIGLTLAQSALTLAFAGAAVWQLRTLARRRRELEASSAALQAARLRAEAASAAKTDFLATMSHELRTPLHALGGMLTLMRTAPLGSAQAAHLHTAQQSAEHLRALLDDLLDVSRLDTGELSLHPAPASLPALVDELQAMLAPTAAERGLSLTVALDPALPAWWEVDRARLRQILLNLLGNALKFTERGSVDLRVARDAAGALRLQVHDTGIGMDAAVMARLFQRFSQGEQGRARRYGGTGLGLEISRRLARAMGGDIEVQSRPGAGSVFTVTLPLMPCAAPPPGDPAPAGGGRALSVLVVDDQPVNRQLLRGLLEHMGHRVREAADGREGVDAVQREAPDLVLMDLHMPVLDGLDATREIRALPAPAGAVKVVAVTADAYAHTRERLLAGGMDGFLGKPLQLPELQGMLRALGARWELAERDAPDAPGAPAAPAAPSPAPGPAPARRARPRVRPGDLAELLDMNVLGDICVGIGIDGLRPLLQGWLADDSGARAALRAALEAGDGGQIRPLAHAVKGSAGSLGLKAVQALARRLELEADDTGPAAGAEAAAALDVLVQRSQAVCRRMGLAE